MHDLSIVYPNGNIWFDIRGFFPVPQVQFKKIVKKIIMLDDDREEKAIQLREEFEEFIRDNEEEMGSYSKRYAEMIRMAAVMEKKATKVFKDDGTKLTDEEFKEIKAKMRNYRMWARQYVSQSRALERKNDKIRKHIEYLDELRW